MRSGARSRDQSGRGVILTSLLPNRLKVKMDTAIHVLPFCASMEFYVMDFSLLSFFKFFNCVVGVDATNY